MIIYRELSSLENDLGYSAKMMYSLSNSLHLHYHEAFVPKGNGEYRKLFVPDAELKSVQKAITDVLLSGIDISPYATAYRIGGSPLVNALPHVGHKILLKLDIRHFFDKITYSVVRSQVFHSDIYSDSNSVLLSKLCCYKDHLPQGSPASPSISNIILRDFDDKVGIWCQERGITYTRYCDDLTFSGSFDPTAVKNYVADELRKLGFFLNEKKTVCVKDGQKMSVTGIVVNHKANITSSYRRRIRQEIYYCMKYGISEHLKAINSNEPINNYKLKLLGKVNYVLSVDAQNAEFLHYKAWLKKEILKVSALDKISDSPASTLS